MKKTVIEHLLYTKPMLFFLNLCLIEVQLLYSIVLIPTKHQRESAIGLPPHLLPLEYPSVLPSHPTPLGCYQAPV